MYLGQYHREGPDGQESYGMGSSVTQYFLKETSIWTVPKGSFLMIVYDSSKKNDSDSHSQTDSEPELADSYESESYQDAKRSKLS